MAKKIGKTIKPRNIVFLEMKKIQRAKTIPAKKGKKAQYSRKKKHTNNDNWCASFLYLQMSA